MQSKKVEYKMENKELKKVRIKNCTCYYFDDVIKLGDFNLDNILIHEKSHKNILIYDISNKTLIVSKPFRIRFDKIDAIIRIYDGTRYLTLFGTKKYDAIYDRIRYLISLKSSITYISSHYIAKIKVDCYKYLSIEKALTLHNVIILIKPLLNKDKNQYYCKIFSEKCSFQLAKKESQFFFHSIITVRFGGKEITKETFYAAKKTKKNWYVNVDNIVFSKLVETTTISNYLIRIKFDKAIRPLVLIMPKISGHVKTFKVIEGGNKLMSFRIDDEKLLEKYKAIWTKIEDLKILN